MTNHVTPDGLLNAIECTRPIRYRDPGLILQDACTAEPRLDLIIRRHGGLDNTVLPVDVARATHMIQALQAFLAAHIGVKSWRHNRVYYSLEHAWQGRPGTGHGIEGEWFRWTGDSRDGLPVMMAITGTDPEGNTEARFALLPQVLGIQPCPEHNIWSDPCHQCILEGRGMPSVDRAHP